MSKFIPGILHHTLRGGSGWSEIPATEILDVANILNMGIWKRLFCIFDKDKPYTLEVEYYKPVTNLAPAFGFNKAGAVVSLYHKTDLYHIITARYQTKQQAQREIDEIVAKQKYLLNIAQKLTADMNYQSPNKVIL